MNSINTLLQQFTNGVSNLVVPLAVAALMVVGAACVCAPMAKNWSAETRSQAMWVFFGLALITFGPLLIAGWNEVFSVGGNH